MTAMGRTLPVSFYAIRHQAAVTLNPRFEIRFRHGRQQAPNSLLGKHNKFAAMHNIGTVVLFEHKRCVSPNLMEDEQVQCVVPFNWRANLAVSGAIIRDHDILLHLIHMALCDAAIFNAIVIY